MKQTSAKKVLKFNDFLNLQFFFYTLFLLFFLLPTYEIYSQNKKNALSVEEAFKGLDDENAKKLKSYLNDIHPTIYFENEDYKLSGDLQPVYFKSDVTSLKKEIHYNSKHESIEFLEIYFSKEGDDNGFLLTDELISGFSNLKYILIRSEYNIPQEKFEKIFSGLLSSNAVLLYEISIPR